MNNNQDDSKWRVGSVSKALTVLKCFNFKTKELSLVQISKLVGLPKSTAYNIVKTLVDEGFLRKSDSSQKYLPGLKLFELGYCARTTLPIISYAIPIMEDVTRVTGEITYLSTINGDKLLVLEGIYPDRRFATYTSGGKALGMHCCSAGKIILSTFSDDMVKKIADKGLTSSTPNTITTYKALKKELDTIRSKGFSVDNEEETLGVRCASVAIYGSENKAVGAISISGSVRSITDKKIMQALPLMEKAAQSLSRMAYTFPAVYPDEINKY